MAKPTITITDKNKTTTVSVSGDLNAQHAHELKSRYVEVLEKKKDVHLALENVTAFDVAALQLTYLLKTEITRIGRKITIVLPQGTALKSILEKSSVHKIL